MLKARVLNILSLFAILALSFLFLERAAAPAATGPSNANTATSEARPADPIVIPAYPADTLVIEALPAK